MTLLIVHQHLLSECVNKVFYCLQNIQHRKYARWKATYIHNCLKNGETPEAGPSGLEAGPGGLDPDLEAGGPP